MPHAFNKRLHERHKSEYMYQYEIAICEVNETYNAFTLLQGK